MRKIYEIAKDIEAAWPNVNYAARPYLDALKKLSSPFDIFIAEDAHSIALYFLANASGFRGPQARALKAELKTVMEAL